MTAAQWTAYILAFLAMNLRVISMSIDSKVRPTGSHTYNSLVNEKHIVVSCDLCFIKGSSGYRQLLFRTMNHETKPNLNSTSQAFGHQWMFYPAALWAATLSFYLFPN